MFVEEVNLISKSAIFTSINERFRVLYGCIICRDVLIYNFVEFELDDQNQSNIIQFY